MNLRPIIEKNIKNIIINNKNKTIPADWNKATIKNIFSNKVDHRGIAPKKIKQNENSIPLLTAKIVKNGYIDKFEEYIDYENYLERCKRGQVKPGDLIFTTEAPMGNVAICPIVNTALGQRMIAFSDKNHNSLFFKYNFLSNYTQAHLKSKATGSTVLGIKSSTLLKLELFFPSLNEQNLISNFLYKQEDVINKLVNIKLNTIKKIKYYQQLLFFGTTRIKLSEEKQKELLSKGIISVTEESREKEQFYFLSINEGKFEEFVNLIDLTKDIIFYQNNENNWKKEEVNELHKKLPKDWNVEQLYKKVNFIKGKAIPENQLNYNGVGLKYLKTTEFWLDSASKRDTVHFTGTIDEKYLKRKDEYVFSMDGFNNKIGEGTLGLISNEDEGIVSTSFYKLEKNNIYHLVVNILKSNYVQNFIMRVGEGTTVYHAGKYMKNLQGVFPKSTVEQKLLSMIFEKEEKLVDSLKEKIKLEEKVFKYLQQELLSGRIRIKSEE